MRKYIGILLWLLTMIVFSTNVHAIWLSNDEKEIKHSMLAVNGERNNDVNINRTDDNNNLNNNNLDNNPNNNLDNNNLDNNNLDGTLNNDHNTLNNNTTLDNLDDQDETLNQTNFLTVLSSGIIGGIIGSVIIYLLMARNK